MITEKIKSFIKEELHMTSDGGIEKNVKLTDGKSGAEVYRINVISRIPRESGNYIIKLINTKNVWYNSHENEATKSSENWKENTPFRHRLVELCADDIVDDHHVLIYRQANDSIINTAALEKLKVSEQCDILEILSYELLQDWNRIPEVKSESENLFNDMLSYRLDIGGSFEKKLENILKDPNASAFLVKDRVYPNPLYYIRTQQAWLQEIQANSFFTGNVHGDLHRRNILCNKKMDNRADSTYFIIDYDSYRKNGFLIFDQAYLELSIYLDLIVSHDMNQWSDVIVPLLETSLYEDAEGGMDEPAVYFRNAICKGISRWQNRNYSHMKDDVEIQFILSRIMAGVNFFSKKAIDGYDALLKVLQYMGICFRILFDKIKFDWDSENVSKLVHVLSKDDYIDELWEKCGKYVSYYTPVLITDDLYTANDYVLLSELAKIKWSLIIDIGEHVAPNDFSTIVYKKMSAISHLITYNLVENVSMVEYSPKTCVWIITKKDQQVPSYGYLWLLRKKIINNLFEQIMAQNGLKPFLFVIDVRKGQSYAQKFLQNALNYFERLNGSRFVILGDGVAEKDDIETIEALKCNYYSLKNATLCDLAETIKRYLPAPSNFYTSDIILPTIETLEPTPLTEKEINYYESSVELVYSGLEGQSQDTDFGISFYQGEEIKWSDLANDYDLELINDYDKKRAALLKAIEEESPRVKSMRLVHGAGTGGTTMSKRLLWDLKDQVPCMRLKKYTQETAHILLEICHKTGKRVFLTVEMGSSILDGEDLRSLMFQVNEGNGKLLVLQIERSNNQTKKEDKESSFIKLQDTLQDPIARNFYRKFKDMTDDDSRLSFLKKITDSDKDLAGQRCPFFYGFYTFQEDYHLNTIEHILSCSDEIIKDLLSDLSIVTIYSQNICIQFQELSIRLKIEKENCSPYLFYEELDPSIAKLVVIREEGLRICHPIIAKKILSILYNTDKYEYGVFPAAKSFIERMNHIYGDEDLVIDNILKELFIDRSYIDSERTRFSSLIEDVPEMTKKKELFERLINLYPRNPHYYNHLARLLAENSFNDYQPSIDLLDKAIEISEQENQNSVVHYVTLGCIYSKHIFANIKNERTLQKTGRLATSFSNLIEDTNNQYVFADGAFEKARQKSVKYNSYVYFPQIHMETRLIEKLVGYDKKERTMIQIYQEDAEFRRWYSEHYGRAVQLLMEMQSHLEAFDKSYKEYLDKAKGLVRGIDIENDQVENQLLVWNSREGREASFYRRTYSLSIYVRNGYNWNNIEDKSLRMIADGMYANVMQSRQNILQYDVYNWYEAFRRLPEFDVGEAIRFLEDYRTDDYEKEYLLFTLHFLQTEKKLSSPMEVMKHINRCKDMVPAGINVFSYRDMYVTYAKGNPIVPYNDIRHDINGSIIGLKEFNGSIMSVKGNTVGTIQIDGVNLSAAFIPSITDEKGRKREFTAENIADRVKFNLMFSYSGLRAWNVDFI